jgi:hypothetical protein
MPRKGQLLVDLTGQRFGRLFVVEFHGRRNRRSIWLCRCDCGALRHVEGLNLKAGNSRSCGCLKTEQSKNAARHGHCRTNRRTDEYKAWAQMLARVRATTGRRFLDYAGRGIGVCERWLSFENFLADMGYRPSPKHSLDRINNDGDYEPSNCRWATASQQVANRRRPDRVVADRLVAQGLRMQRQTKEKEGVAAE